MASTSVGKSRVRAVARSYARSASPLCSASAPQQPWPCGHHHLHAVGRQHPQRRQRDLRMRAPVARSRPAAPHAPACGPAPRRVPAAVTACGKLSGSRASIGRTRAGSRPDMRCAKRPMRAATRNRRRRLERVRSSVRCRRSMAGRAPVSRPERNGTMRSPYCTPDGHAVTQPRQPRQRSMCGCDVGQRECRPRAPASSARCGRAASPSPRRAPCRSGRPAGRSRSARTSRPRAPWRRAADWTGRVESNAARVRTSARRRACGSMTDRRRCSNGFGASRADER